MAIRGIFECIDCNNRFERQEGGTMRYEEYSCVSCDSTTMVRRRIDAEEPDLRCKKCKSEMRSGLKRMCPACGSRNTKVSKIIVKID